MSVTVFDLSGAEFFAALDAIGAEHGVRSDRRLVQQQYHPPYTLDTLARAARALGPTSEPEPWSGELPTDRRCLLALSADDPDAQAEGPAGEGVSGISRPAAPTRITLGILDPSSQTVRLLGKSGPGAVSLEKLRTRLLGFGLLLGPRVWQAETVDPAPGGERVGLKWFISALGRHRRVWVEVVVASLFVQILALAVPLIAQAILDKVIVHRAVSTLWVLGAAVCMVIVFTAAMSWARQLLVLHAGNRIDAELGDRAFAHLLGLPLRWFEQRSAGTVLARMQGIESVREFLSGAMVSIALDLPFTVVFLAIMFWYSWQLTLVVLILLALLTGLSLATAPVLRRRLNRQFHAGARIQALLTEFISNMESVKALQIEPQLGSRYRTLLGEYLLESLLARRLSGTLSVLAGLLEQLSGALVLCIGAWLVMQNSGFTIGMLIAFQMFSSRLSQPLLRLSALWQEFQQASIALSRLDDLLRVPTEPMDFSLRHAGPKLGHIRIENLCFRYAKNRPPVIEGLDLEIPAGQCVLISGPSGAGKSTLAKLLLGFQIPDQGTIRIDGRDIVAMPANELRSHFGVVMQESVLFAGTLLENLELANPGVKMDEVVAACRLAGMHDVINALPDGYQSRIGEHGTGLSGGQRQRIAIARALLRHPVILLCDEPVGHLDAASAAEMVQTLNGLHGKVAVIFIAHEAPAGLHVDRFVALKSGGDWEGS